MVPSPRLRVLVDAPWFTKMITAVILVNAVTLGAETSPELLASYGDVLHLVDRTALVIFVVELTLRFCAYGRDFFRDPWNWFDTLVVAVTLLPASGMFSVLRALRVLRVLRLVSVVPSMRRVVAALLTALPGMASITALLALVLYVSAVIATKLFSPVAPEYFGGLGESLFTLFHVMTGEAWSEVAREVMAEKPLAWVFFVGYLVVTSFTVLNLFIAVAVSAMQTPMVEEHAEHDREEMAATLEILAEVRKLRADLDALRSAAPAALATASTSIPHVNVDPRRRHRSTRRRRQ
ncbi:voltage-gated sodium channel [Lentzea fradiae]|uniref:Voltage-gated sodium channel n=1 Tax=Lentzea fradiae TaxID=200378 RepID=A0A1G7V9V2_9PSEU|nr:ion transporter [Lentzea fradiae]SDG56592.1 voltage-gated sodium channel [Lentzea fradiae]